jgi:hypothetical protein
MLEITPEAGLAIHSLVSAHGVASDGGLRIETLRPETPGAAAFDVTVASSPATEDQVVAEETTGARVFLDPAAEGYLGDKTLDVDPIDGEDIVFRLKTG